MNLDATQTALGPSAELQIPGYTVLQELGSGGMATVYLARQERLSRLVALKIIHSAGDDEFARRFTQEARVASQFNHPHIITIHDFGQHGQLLYMAMEYASGGTLRARMHQFRDLGKICQLTKQIAAALHYLHQHNIIHRDVKPANILFRQDETPVLADFGIVKAQDETRYTQLGMALGTPNYMSQEQALGEDVDGRSDFYSLGVMLYELLCQHKPFTAETGREYIPPLPKRLLAFQPLINQLLAVDPALRPADADSIAQALDAAYQRCTLHPQRHLWRSVLGSSLALVLAGAAYWHWRPHPLPPWPDFQQVHDLPPPVLSLMQTAEMLRSAGRLATPVTSNSLALLCRALAQAPEHPALLSYYDNLLAQLAQLPATTTLEEYEQIGLHQDLRPCQNNALDAQRQQALTQLLQRLAPKATAASGG